MLFLVVLTAVCGQVREVAITFDDLPRGGDRRGGDLDSVRKMTRKLVGPLEGVPVTAFVNAGRGGLQAAGLQEILKLWLDAGAELGNHTYSHPDINSTSLERYEADVIKGEPAITQASGRQPLYFRHPFLHTGKDAITKRELQAFLERRKYVVAPVTLDNSDYMFALVYASSARNNQAAAERVRDAYVSYMESIFAFFEARSLEVVGRPFPQILLLHANQLNADAMPALLQMMRKRGYRFVTLAAALRDPAYRLPDPYAGPGGFSWIHRWAQGKKMPARGEPDEPEWIREGFKSLQKQ